MKKWLSVLTAVFLVLSVGGALAGKDKADKLEKLQAKRENIDRNARNTLEKLLKENHGAKKLYDQAYGYAVFDNTKVSFGLTGSGGSGVAVEKPSKRRTYMRMGSGGVSVGIGAQVYQVVFLFQNKDTFQNFVEKGWDAEASANAVAGKAGVNAEATFTNGLALYQFTKAGLMLQADISGTKYWKSKKLNGESGAK